MSPYFCWSLLSFSLKTAGMKSERRNSSAMMAFPLETILRMAWPHRLFSAKKSTIAAGGRGGGWKQPHFDPDPVFMQPTDCFNTPAEKKKGKFRVLLQFRLIFLSNYKVLSVLGEGSKALNACRHPDWSWVRLLDLGNSLLHWCYLFLANQGMLVLSPEIVCVIHLTLNCLNANLMHNTTFTVRINVFVSI